MKSVSPRVNSGRLLLSLMSSLVMAGCVSSGGGHQTPTAENFASDWLHTGSSVTYLSPEHSNIVEQATPDKLVSLGRTPWGEGTRVQVKNSYFSASGKSCFSTIILTRDAAPNPVNLCKYSEGRWGATRAFSPAEPGSDQMTVGDVK